MEAWQLIQSVETKNDTHFPNFKRTFDRLTFIFKMGEMSDDDFDTLCQEVLDLTYLRDTGINRWETPKTDK